MTSSCLAGWPGWPSQYWWRHHVINWWRHHLLLSQSYVLDLYLKLSITFPQRVRQVMTSSCLTGWPRYGHLISTDDIITSTIYLYIHDDIITCRSFLDLYLKLSVTFPQTGPVKELCQCFTFFRYVWYVPWGSKLHAGSEVCPALRHCDHARAMGSQKGLARGSSSSDKTLHSPIECLSCPSLVRQ